MVSLKKRVSDNRTFFMGLAMIAIVCFHHAWTVIPVFSGVTSQFGLWGVDIFLFLSGFGCVYALNKYTTSTFFRKRALRLLPTCFVIGLMVYCADLYFQAERTHTLFVFRILSLHRWYIQCIIICYALTPLAFLILKRYGGWGLIAMVSVAIVAELFIPDMDIWRVKWIFGRIPVFLIGMYLAIFDIRLSRREYAVSCISLVFAVITRCRGGYFVFQWTYFLAAAMPFICETLCTLRSVCEKFHIYKFVELMGLYSLEIYLIHEYTFWFLYEQSIPLMGMYVLFVVIVAIFSWIAKNSVNLLIKLFSNK